MGEGWQMGAQITPTQLPPGRDGVLPSTDPLRSSTTKDHAQLCRITPSWQGAQEGEAGLLEEG